ncbi:MAG: hypothetical protein H0V68_03075 [Actinobacteria bacterium]|nr:hypothetical protein [Actinomycetota bacterium]
MTTTAALLLIPRHGAEGAAGASAIGYGAGGIAAWLLVGRVARSARAEPPNRRA